MENFRSDSALLRYEIKKILGDGKEHFRKDIMNKIEADYPSKDFSPGKWAGVFRAVLNEPGYISPSTGSYQFIGVSSNLHSLNVSKESSTFINCQGILKEALGEIQKEVADSPISKKNPLELSQSEFAEVQQIRNLISKLEELLSN